MVVLSTLTIQIFLRLKEKKEDQRLAKGLQLLQNKISILEDLADRTDHQVQKTVQTLDSRTTQIKELIFTVEQKNLQIRAALEVASETQKNIIHYAQPTSDGDQQNIAMRVHAAKLANQGFTQEQILQQINLNPAEVDLIFKVNKDKLQFAEDQLPAWANTMPERPTGSVELSDFEKTLRQQKEKLNLLKSRFPAAEPTPMATPRVSASLPPEPVQTVKTEASNQDQVRPFVFPKFGGKAVNQNYN